MNIFNKKANLYIWVLILFNAFFIGCYFSGVTFLQQLIAPTIDKANFSFKQMREFGILEMTQNVLLLYICYVLLREMVQRRELLEKLFFGIGSAIFVFLFLEELDYGLHIYKFFTGELGDVQYFSWHNQWEDGVEKATTMKKVADLVIGVWFVIIPLLLSIPILSSLKERIAITPSRWFIISLILAVVCSKIAHSLDDNGFGVINGVQGNLYKTIAEFRETSLYYLFLLYAIQLKQTLNPLRLLGLSHSQRSESA